MPPAKYRWFAFVFALSLALDQGSKVWARHVLRPIYPAVKTIIPGFFDLRYSENPGSAFGLFRGVPGARYLLFVVGIGALIIVATYLRKARARRAAARRRAGPAGRRRARQRHRPHHLRPRHRLHRLEGRPATSGRRSTSPTPRSSSASSACCSTCAPTKVRLRRRHERNRDGSAPLAVRRFGRVRARLRSAEQDLGAPRALADLSARRHRHPALLGVPLLGEPGRRLRHLARSCPARTCCSCRSRSPSPSAPSST